MLKILLIGVATGAGSYNNISVFKNRVPENYAYPDGYYHFDKAEDIIGTLPCEVNQLYNSLNADQNQKNFEKSIYKNFADIRLLMDNAQSHDFSNDDVEIHTFKVTNGEYSIIEMKDTATVSGEYGKPLDQVVLEITSDIQGNEYNYFTVDVSLTGMTISYNAPSDPNIIKIDDIDIQKPFTTKLLYKDIHEIKSAIEKSPFAKYLSCKVHYFNMEKTVAPTLNEYIELPDEKDSYRINDINTAYALYTEKFTIGYGESNYVLNNKISRKELSSISVITTQRYYVADEDIIKVYAEDAISKPVVIKGADYVENVNDISSYIKLKNTAILGDEILIQYNRRLDVNTEDFFTLAERDGKSAILLNKRYDFESNDFTVSYGKNIKDFKIINKGLLGTGKVTDILDWDKKLDKIDDEPWTGFIWLEHIRPDFVSLVSDVKNKRSTITSTQLKQIYIKYLNNLISSVIFQHIGLNETPQIENLMVKEGYNDFSCRKINILSIQAEDDPELSTDIVFDSSSEVSFPPMFYFSNSFNNATNIKIYYSCYGNMAVGSYTSKDGTDLYEMNDEDYFTLLQEKFYEYNMDEYILMNRITDVILCGCYENTYFLKTTLDEYTDAQSQIENRQFTINISDLVPNSAGAKNYPSKYYYKLDGNILDNELIKSIKILDASSPEALSEVELIGDTLYFKNFNVLTGSPELDIKTNILPAIFYIEYTLFVNKKIAYDQFIDQQYTIEDEEDKYAIQQSIPVNFRLSLRPFVMTEALSLTIGNLERQYLDYVRDQIILFNAGAVKKSNIIRYCYGNIYTEQTFFGETIESFIDPSVFSTITDYICMRLFKTRKSINWTTEFNEVVKTRYITDLTEEDIIDDFYNNGIELFEARSIDDATLCVVNRTVNILSVLKDPTYLNYVKSMIITIYNSKKKFIGLLFAADSTITDDMEDAIRTEFGALIKNVTIKITDKTSGYYKMELNITFVNLNVEIAVPITLL